MNKQEIAQTLRDKMNISLAIYDKNMSLSSQTTYENIKGKDSKRLIIQVVIDINLIIWAKNEISTHIINDYQFMSQR